MSNSTIQPSSLIDPSAIIGEGVEIGPFCIVGPDVVVGDRVRMISHVTVDGYTTIGEDCVLYPNVHLGHPPQDFKFEGERTELVLGKRNILRENATMHPGTAFGGAKTVVGDDGYFMVGSHVAHDCTVGDRVVFANGATIGGSSTIEDHVILGGYAGVHQNTLIGRHAFIGAMALIVGDIIPYGSAIGNHAHLVGLNVIGLKRRGIPRDTIRDLRSAYRLLFAAEGTFQERLQDVARVYESNEPVMEVISFIRKDSLRSLCMPHD